MVEEDEFMANTIAKFISEHSSREVKTSLHISERTIERFKDAVSQRNFMLTLSLVPSASYLDIARQIERN